MCHSCIPGWNEWRFGQREWRKSCKAAIFLIRIWFFEHQLKIKIRTDRKHLHWTGFSERWVTEASLVHVNGASFDFLFTVYLFHSRVVSCGTLLGSVQTNFVYLMCCYWLHLWLWSKLRFPTSPVSFWPPFHLDWVSFIYFPMSIYIFSFPSPLARVPPDSVVVQNTATSLLCFGVYPLPSHCK